LTISNAGDADLRITDVSTDDSAFLVTIDGGLPVTIEPDGEAEAGVTFAPDSDGVFNSKLLVSSADPDTPALIVRLTGEGIAIPGELIVEATANSDAFEFRDALQVDLTIENTGEPVTVDLFVVLTFDLGGPEERHW